MNLEGKIIGNRYEIIEKIGNGGMAIVYKARCTILNRYVAVKVLKEEFTTDEEFIKRFNSEAQAAASLTHPNIVSVFDVGQEYNIYYIVMELIQGKTLKEIIVEDGALPWKWSVNIAIQICSALEVAHKNGIIHRDIKPHNIMITEDGIAKVTDFGIAKAVSNSTITAFGTTIGSVHYFSPEHARGGFTDAKSDIYSLGVVMYEMLTGRVPFDADTPVSVALKHIQEEAVPAIELNSKIPSAVNDIIVKAMKKDASMRYESATQMMRDLSLALKNPTGAFVQEKKEGDFTRTIPTVNEEKLKSSDVEPSYSRNYDRNSKKSAVKSKGLKGYLEANPEKKPLVITGIVIIVLVLAVALFAGSMKLTSNLFGNGGGSNTEIILKNVESISVQEAKTILDAAGVKYEIEEVYNKDVPEGNVIEQDPKPGTTYSAKKNRPVKIKVSKGAKVVSMPKIKGLQYDEAVSELEKYELVAERVEEKSFTVEEGYVIKQDLNEGTSINAGETVKVYVSIGTGLEKVAVPVVTDIDIEKAKQILTEQKLEVNVIYKEDTSKSNGIVLKQSIEVGEVVEEGTAITLTVNKIQEIKEGTVNINVKSLSEYKEEIGEDGKPKKPGTVDVRVSVDGEDVYKKEKVAKNTENINVTVTGKGIITVRVYINEIRVKEAQMDLNGSNTVLNVKKD